jgi:signal transduction histidine kinase
MSATLQTTSAARHRDPAWQATAAGAAAMLGGLALALADASSSAVAVALTLAGAVVAIFLLAPRAVAAMHSHPVLIVIGVVGLLGLLAIALRVLALIGSLPAGLDLLRAPQMLASRSLLALTVMTLAAGGGLVLIADALRVRLGLGVRAPWDEMTGAGQDPDRTGMPWRAVAGALLVGWAGFLGIGLAGPYVAGNPGLQLALLMLVAAAAATVIGTPLLIAALTRRDREQVGAWEDERRRFAAHLHDSVLQTLALVQRQAHDPVAVARLARRQEHALRAWMAGTSELLSETLAGALRVAVADVEDEHDVNVEVSIIGDRSLDAGGEALAAATREALRNAARHAAGAPVFVFAQIEAKAVEVFVRDEGAGFELAEVPAERRGLRDAVIGRMAAAGGTATVESVAGEGTEVALRLGAMA